MTEYISREYLVQLCKKMIDDTWNQKCAPASWAHAYADFLDNINDAPAADVSPVVHGRWDASGRYKFADGSVAVRCDKCGAAMSIAEFRRNVWNYCPVCGAKMDLEENAWNG